MQVLRCHINLEICKLCKTHSFIVSILDDNSFRYHKQKCLDVRVMTQMSVYHLHLRKI